jgi:hypothetical protein
MLYEDPMRKWKGYLNRKLLFVHNKEPSWIGVGLDQLAE